MHGRVIQARKDMVGSRPTSGSPQSPARSAAFRRRKQCQPMPASISMTAKGADRLFVQSKAIAAFSAHTEQRPVHQSSWNLAGHGSACCGPAKQEDARSRDWLSNYRSYSIAWCLPLALFPIGLLANLPLRTALWAGALTWMGGACLINAQRSGRTHCRFTGPFYLAMILPVLIFGTVSASLASWLALGVVIVVGSRLVWWATERAWGQFS
jgi:hypothetical protein